MRFNLVFMHVVQKILLLRLYLAENGQDSFKLSYAQIEDILGFPIDHSFLKYKKELLEYGYQAGKISMKEETVAFEKVKP